MEKKDGFKLLNIRMTKELWLFLKQHSMNKEISMNQIVLKSIRNYRKTVLVTPKPEKDEP